MMVSRSQLKYLGIHILLLLFYLPNLSSVLICLRLLVGFLCVCVRLASSLHLESRCQVPIADTMPDQLPIAIAVHQALCLQWAPPQCNEIGTFTIQWAPLHSAIGTSTVQ